MARLGWTNVTNGYTICGATVIASRWAVTATHCLKDKPNGNWQVETGKFFIVLGEHDDSDDNSLDNNW